MYVTDNLKWKYTYGACYRNLLSIESDCVMINTAFCRYLSVRSKRNTRRLIVVLFCQHLEWWVLCLCLTVIIIISFTMIFIKTQLEASARTVGLTELHKDYFSLLKLPTLITSSFVLFKLACKHLKNERFLLMSFESNE